MDLDSLKQFINLAKTLNYGKASRLSHVSPSTLSRSIQRLEASCGKALFERDRHHVAITPAGQQFLQFAETQLQQWAQLVANLEQMDGVLKGSLTLYCSVTACYSVLPPLLRAFREVYPQVHLKLVTGDANLALDYLLNGDSELAIAPLPPRLPSALEGMEITQTPLALIGPTQAGPVERLLKRKTILWQEVPFIMPESGLIRSHIQAWFQQKAIQPPIYGDASGHEAILSLVSLGMGVGVVPQLVLTESLIQTQVQVIEVVPAFPTFHVGLCVRKTSLNSALVKAFWNTAQHRLHEPG